MDATWAGDSEKDARGGEGVAGGGGVAGEVLVVEDEEADTKEDGAGCEGGLAEVLNAELGK